MQFATVVHGECSTKKNRPILDTRGARPRMLPCREFQEWSKHAVPQLRSAWHSRGMGGPHIGPVWVSAQFYRTNRRADLLNLMQALADVLEEAEVLHNDSQIQLWDGSRQLVDKTDPRVCLSVQSYEAMPVFT